MVPGLPCLLGIRVWIHIVDMRAARVQTKVHVMSECVRAGEVETCLREPVEEPRLLRGESGRWQPHCETDSDLL